MKPQTDLALERARKLILGSPNLPHAQLIDLLQPSIKLVTRIVENEIPMGQSRFGGLPDLHPSIEWPRWNGYVDPKHPQLGHEAQTLSFVAQIDLATIDDLTDSLPQAGLLSFFFDVVQKPWGYKCGHRGAGRVFYTEPGTPLVRRTAPVDLDPDAVLGQCAVSSRIIATLPDWPGLGAYQWEEPLRLQYLALAHDDIAEGEPHHRMFGWPMPVQGEMTTQCERMLRGIDEHIDAPDDEFLRAASDWVLLLQMDSDEALPVMWDDSGSLYFWIRRSDLASRRFDRVWTIVQSC